MEGRTVIQTNNPLGEIRTYTERKIKKTKGSKRVVIEVTTLYSWYCIMQSPTPLFCAMSCAPVAYFIIQHLEN